MTILPADYCPDCGCELAARPHEGDQQPYCKACDRMYWQQPIPCVDLAVVDGKQVLLIKRNNSPHVGKWAFPGGIIDINESPAEAAVRELHEEAGIEAAPTDLVLFDSFAVAAAEGWHTIGINFVVARENTTGTPVSGTDVQDARFWSLKELQHSGEEPRPTPDEESRMRSAIKKSGSDGILSA